MEILILLGALGLIVGMIASGKGRSFFPWFLYGGLLFIVAIIHVLVITTGKVCPECRSAIDGKATICKFCRYNFPKQEAKVITEEEKKKDLYNTKKMYWLIVLALLGFAVLKMVFH